MPVQVIGSVCDIAYDGGQDGQKFTHNSHGHDCPSKSVLVMDQAGLLLATIRLLPLLACRINHESE